MYEMVKLLTGLQQRIHTLLIEYEDHHELQKIMNAIEMLMNIPLNTCLAKVLILPISTVNLLCVTSILSKNLSKRSFHRF